MTRVTKGFGEKRERERQGVKAERGECGERVKVRVREREREEASSDLLPNNLGSKLIK